MCRRGLSDKREIRYWAIPDNNDPPLEDNLFLLLLFFSPEFNDCLYKKCMEFQIHFYKIV